MPKQAVSSDDGEDLPPEQIHCKKQACAIQYCLARRNLQQNACQAYIEAWEQCRDKARAMDSMKKKNEVQR